MLDASKLPQDSFPHAIWNEVRLDIDAGVQPDIVASIVDLRPVPSECFDAVFSSHNIEHLYPHEVSLALGAFLRVLKPGGFALIHLPDLQTVAELIAQDKLEDSAYISEAGAIAPIDMIYGYRPALAAGNHFMAHRTGFTARSLHAHMSRCGYINIEVQRFPDQFSLQAVGFRRNT